MSPQSGRDLSARAHPEVSACAGFRLCGGAIVASAILLYIASGTGHFDPVTTGFATNGYGARLPGHYSLSAAFVVETIMTALLVVILSATDIKAPVGFAGLAIRLALTLIHLVSISVTNTSVNPARSIEPRSQNLKHDQLDHALSQ
jgi:aquaporin Z